MKRLFFSFISLFLLANVFLFSYDDKDFVLIEEGVYEIGTNNTSAKAEEKPAHSVKLSAYLICKYEVSQKTWQEVMGGNPSKFPSGDDYPIENVTWYQAIDFCNKLSIIEGLTPVYTIDDIKKDDNNLNSSDNLKKVVIFNSSANGYRLPTSAEWEAAARGGNKTKNFKFSGSNKIDEVGWFANNSGKKTNKIGTKRPNELGLYDMTGNVIEWCWDWFGANYYQNSPEQNPTGPEKGETKVARGGAWNKPEAFNTNTLPTGTNLWFSSWINGLRVCKNALE